MLNRAEQQWPSGEVMEIADPLQTCIDMLRDEHRKYHGEVFIFDTEKACCPMGQAIIDAQRKLSAQSESSQT